MTTKSSKTKQAAKPADKPNGSLVAQFPEAADQAKAAAMARMALKPSVNAALVVDSYSQTLGDQDLGALMTELSAGMTGLWGGDMRRTEAMLYGQAHALQAIFMSLARRAANQEYLKQWEANLRMALKAQAQCRATLETLAAIKNPPVVFARQANINNGGQQQVNNGTTPSMPTVPRVRTGETESQRSELLEASNGQGLDTRTAGAAGGADQDLAPVGAINRAEVLGR